MIAIQKIRVSVASNGAFKCNALMVKTTRLTKLVTENVFVPGGLTTEPEHVACAINGASLRFAQTIHAINVPSAAGVAPCADDSFVTAMLMLESFAPTSDYRFEPVGEARFIRHGEFVTFDFASEFADANARNADISGVAFKDGYERSITYSGIDCYHGSIGSYHRTRGRGRFNLPLSQDKPWRIGVELEVYARNTEAFRTITDASSNWFICEHDGSLTESINGDTHLGIEIKTIPLKACDAKSVDFWAAPMARLKQLAMSHDQQSTGLHVHIGKEILGDTEAERQDTLNKLSFFYYYLVEDIPANHAKNVAICGRERGYGTLDNGMTELGNIAKEVGLEHFQKAEKAFKELSSGVKDKISGYRGDINMGNLETYGTIEFRKGKGSIGKTRLAALVTWWEQMCLYCRHTPGAELNFDAFFTKVTREYPAVAYYFQQEQEA